MSLPVLLMLIGQSGYAGSPLPAVHAALEAAEVKATDVVFDIGSGDGRVVALAVKGFGARAVGIERDVNLVKISRRTLQRNRIGARAEIRHEDALTSSLTSATVVYLYHQSGFLAQLRHQIESLRAGTRIVCLDHPLPWLSMEPVITLTDGGHEHKVYLWVCGVQDSVLVTAGRHYPGVRFYEGLRDPLLVDLAQTYAEQMANINSQSNRGEGHFGWDERRTKIRRELGLKGNEVSAEIHPWESGELGQNAFHDWQRSSGHWAIVSQPHDRYGDGIAKSRQGVVYVVIIVAD